MRTSTTPTQADTLGPRRPIRVDHGDRYPASAQLSCLDRFAAFRAAGKGGRL